MITKKQTLVIGGAAAVLALIGGGTALAATSVRGSAGAQVPYLAGSDPNPPLCVTFGPDGGATGNYAPEQLGSPRLPERHLRAYHPHLLPGERPGHPAGAEGYRHQQDGMQER